MEEEDFDALFDPGSTIKPRFGHLYEAVRAFAPPEMTLRPWEDLAPQIQLMFANMIVDDDNLLGTSFRKFASFIVFMNDPAGAQSAEGFVDGL